MAKKDGQATHVVVAERRQRVARYVKLVSRDKREFIVKREHALMSATIRAMLSVLASVLDINNENVVHLNGIPSNVLAIICKYLGYKADYVNTLRVQKFHVPPEIAYDVLMAATFLEC